MKRVVADILAGYLTLLGKPNYLGVESLGKTCIQEHTATSMKSGNVGTTEDAVKLLEERIAIMKEHIEKAEQFLGSVESGAIS